MDADLYKLITGTLSPMAPIPTDLQPAGQLERKPRAVLFDIYGTLLVSGTGDISLASLQNETIGISETLERSGFQVLLPDVACEKIPPLMDRIIRQTHSEYRSEGADYPEVEIRDVWKAVLAELWKEGILESDPAAAEEKSGADLESLALLHELSVNPVWAMPGFPEIVSSIALSGIRTGIVSNAQFYTPLILKALTGSTLAGLGFEDKLCSWSYRILRAKPSPEIFRSPIEALQADGISPSDILYVGNDMLNDVSTASKAGCMTTLFAGDRRSLRLREGDDRVSGPADTVITELEQLKVLISGGSLDGPE